MTFAVIGNADQIAELLCGPRQHDAHCQGWRWHLYMQDQRKRHAAMNEGVRQIIAARNAARDVQIQQLAAE